MAISEFGKAFREARAAGDKTFTFNGKKYTTEMADDKPRSVGGTPKMDKYVARDSDARKGEEMTSKNYVPRDSFDRKGETMTSKNAVARDNYERSGQKAFDTEAEPSEIMANRYRDSGMNRSDENRSYKRGGSIKSSKMGSVRTSKPSMSSASSRADGIASRGKTRGRMV